MKIGRLSREQIDFFADMDPLMMLERLEFPNCFALAATETDTQTGEELPAGLMVCAKSDERLPIVTPLQQLTRAKLREALDSLASLEGAAMLYSAADAGAYLDEKLSFLISAKGEIRGGILVQCISRNLYETVDDTLVSAGKEQVLCPVYFCAQSVQEEKALIFAAMQAAAKKYAPDTEVHIICRSNGCDRLMHEVLPEDGTPSRLLIADVAEYFDQIEQTDDYLL